MLEAVHGALTNIFLKKAIEAAVHVHIKLENMSFSLLHGSFLEEYLLLVEAVHGKKGH